MMVDRCRTARPGGHAEIDRRRREQIGSRYTESNEWVAIAEASSILGVEATELRARVRVMGLRSKGLKERTKPASPTSIFFAEPLVLRWPRLLALIVAAFVAVWPSSSCSSALPSLCFCVHADGLPPLPSRRLRRSASFSGPFGPSREDSDRAGASEGDLQAGESTAATRPG